MSLTQLTRDLVRFNTVNPSGTEHQCADYLGKYLEGAGFGVSYHSFSTNRTSLIARIPGNQDRAPLCLTGHIDTVPLGAAPWSFDPFSCELDGDRMYGRGTTDMKAAVAAFAVAASEITQSKRPKAGLELVITAGEETGCEGAIYLANQAGALSQYGAIVVGEPTSNYPLVGHKGAYWIKLITRGITAHGSMPEKGDNAIHKASDVVTKLSNYRWNKCDHEMLGKPTLNIGVIEGGMNMNSVPDKAVVGVDIRTVPGQSHSDIRADLQSLVGDDVEIEEVVEVEGIWSNPGDEWIQGVYNHVHEVTHISPQAKGATYFTDGPVLARACNNPPTIILGPGEAAMAHQTDEYCEVSRMEQSVELYRRIIEDWCYR